MISSFKNFMNYYKWIFPEMGYTDRKALIEQNFYLIMGLKRGGLYYRPRED